MKRRISERLTAIAFVVSVATLALFYGVQAQRAGWFPSQEVALAEETLKDLAENWRDDLGLEPSRHLVDAYAAGRPAGESGYRVFADGLAAPGFIAVAGLSPDQEQSFHAVTLFDDAGNLLHRWPVNYDRLDPEGNPPEDVMLHGLEIFEDGSIAVTFDMGRAIARIDACGEPIWTIRNEYHHSIARDGNGSLWSWRGDDIEQIDEETGAVVSKLSLLDQIMPAGDGQEGVFALRAITDEKDRVVLGVDPFHTNDVEPLTAELADAFPMFEEGDLLISLREINLVAVVDPDDGRLRWYRHGPWHRQHDPDFQPDGTITVLDNGTGTGRSRILRVDPASGEVSDVFLPREDAPFYTWRRGKHQILPNGNILVTEAERGRIFEAAPDGSLVWEREMPWDAGRNLIVTEARHLPPDFFRDGLPSCDTSPDDAKQAVR